ncbi:sensor histidine kinase [Clostridium felsineum]|uniref:sensor histidine kinase n=1 Tax=Clostridium felsineum TaxID=36839 RepID=UPI00098CA096|nr:HAMP domain-containing sensor histidine kinase [Clostridium felsineum]URZ17663.1 Adaptive-response sensory-kinase SasA [Clostridium felsineum DSM 794]
MLKIKSRIALLYSALTIFFIIVSVILFCVALKIYINREPILESINQNIKSKTASDKSRAMKKKNKEGNATKNFIYDNSNNGGIEKCNIQVDDSNKNSVEGFVYQKDGSMLDVYKTKKGKGQHKYTQNYLETIFDENNNIITSNILPDDYSKDNLNKQYGTKDLKIYSKNEISLKELLNRHNAGRLCVITDMDDNVIRSQVLSNDVYNRIYGRISNGNSFEMNSKQFQDVVMHVLYKRFIYIIVSIISMVIIVNFILSKRYVAFALKPLMEFTYKVKKQSESKEIEFIEMPEVKDEIYDLTSAYNSAMKKVKKSYNDLQRLNSYASHELRNSLSVLKAKLELGENTKEIEAYIDKLTNTTNDILAMSTPKLCNNENVDLALICAKVVDEYTSIFKNIELRLPDDGVNLIKGKELWIERCVTNLIDNSIKFIDERKVNNKILVEVLENANDIAIKVYDNGVGIDEQRMGEIFKPYYGTNRRISTGIGLAYVKHIMNLHNGKVLVKSEKGEYCEISLVFYKSIQKVKEHNV